jgi:hypothetical protein
MFMAGIREFLSSWNWVKIGWRARRHILKVANAHFDDLMELWEEAHA